MSVRPDHSPSRLLSKVRRFARRRWNCKEYVLYFKPLSEANPNADRQDGPLLFRVATPQDIAWMSRYLGAWASWCRGGEPAASAEPLLREQFAENDITIVGAESRPGGAPVYVADLCRDEFGLRLLADAFNSGSEVSIRRVWVAPSHRRQGVASRGETFAAAEAARRGLRGIWSFVRIDNKASQAMHRKLGYVDRGRGRILTRLGRRYAAVRLDPADNWRKQRVDYCVSHL